LILDSFNLLLFGETNLHLPYYVYAFEEMGKTGMERVNNFLFPDVIKG